MKKAFLFLLLTIVGCASADDACGIANKTIDEFHSVLLDIVLCTEAGCFLGNRSIGKLETASQLSTHISESAGLQSLSQCMLELYMSTNSRCLNCAAWNNDSQKLWVTDVIEVQHRVKMLKGSEHALMLAYALHNFVKNVKDSTFNTSPVSDTQIESHALLIKKVSPRNSSYSSPSELKAKIVHRIRTIWEDILLQADLHNSHSMYMFCKSHDRILFCDPIYSSQWMTEPPASPSTSVKLHDRGFSEVNATLQHPDREEVPALTLLAPLVIGASMSAGSVAGSVYLTAAGSGSVFLASVGIFSGLSERLGISSMAAGPVFLSLAPILATYTSLFLTVPNDIAGITSKVLSAGASLLAPYGVYSVLTVHGAGYVSMMKTLAQFGGGTIISGGGGAAVGVGVVAALAGAGVYAVCMGCYALVTLSQNFLHENPSALPLSPPLLSSSQQSLALTHPPSIPSRLEEEVAELMAKRERLHQDTLFWEEHDGLWWWRTVVMLLATGVIFTVMATASILHHRKGSDLSTSSSTVEGHSPPSPEKDQREAPPETKLEVGRDDDTLREAELEKMRACLSVEEYEAFLQKQKELLRVVHADIRSEVHTLNFGLRH